MPFLILLLCPEVHHILLAPIKSQTNLRVIWTLIWDDLKCATTHLSITEIKYLQICTDLF